MKFTLASTYRYWWPVTAHIPDPANPGEIVAQDLRVEFEPLPQDEITAATEESAKLKTLRETVEHGIRQMQRVVKNWEGVVDAAGNPVPFTPELLAQALQFPWFRAAINKALLESQNGEAARQGN